MATSPHALLLLLVVVDGGQGGPDVSVNNTATPAAPSLPKQAAQPKASRTFAAPRIPKAWRVQAWVQDRRGDAPLWESDYPEFHFSRFLRLARPKFHPPKQHDLTDQEQRIGLFRFASAVIADWAALFDIACPKGRCAPVMEETKQLLTTFVHNGSGGFSAHEQHGGGRFDDDYRWRLQSGPASFEVGCDDMVESPEVFCQLELALSDQLVMTYEPKTQMAVLDSPDIAIRRKREAREDTLGEIRFHRDDHGRPVVTISQSLLAGSAEPGNVSGSPRSTGTR